ncbi:MAG TPA: DUF6152 family protein [Burkholderiaceae bacterium]|nr:DUF6152 family protein [Burkholderiaceae bacterium]
MQRRSVLGLLGSSFAIGLGGAVVARPAQAHHGWSSFDPDRPLYLRGRVKSVQWRNPHAEFELELAPDLALPADLQSRALPEQTSRIDGKAILEKTRLPERKDRVWEIELAPLTRMKAWSVEPLAEGETIELIGYTLADGSEPVLRAEWLFRDGKVYGMRSSPA